MNADVISLIEGTTRFINVDVLYSDKSRMDLTGYKAYLSIVCDDTLIVRRECNIIDNVVSTKIEPRDTLGRVGYNMKYEVRVIDDESNMVLAIKSGKIKVIQSIDPIITENPELIEGEYSKEGENDSCILS